MERFLSSLAGIRSARVVALEPGTLDEIHVLCAPSLQPKQVVRNVESALCAGLGIRIDRRIVSVAQLREEIGESGTAIGDAPQPAAPRVADDREASAPAAHEADADAPPAIADASVTGGEPGRAESGGEPGHAEGGGEPGHAEGVGEPGHAQGGGEPRHAEGGREPGHAQGGGEPRHAERPGDAQRQSEAERSRRFLFVGYDSSSAGGQTRCRVTIRRGREQFTGSATGANTAQGRASAAAEAVLHAVGDAANGSLSLDGARLTELGGRPFVLVSALGITARENLRLTGVAALVRSPEEAAILAGLHAANRWSEPR